MLRWLLSPPSSHQPLSPEKSCCSAGDWLSPFSLLCSPSPHLSTLSPTSELLMLESRVETQPRCPSVPRSFHRESGRLCDYLFFRWHPCLCRGTNWKEFIRGFSERVFVMGLVVCRACRIYEHLRNQPPLQSTFSASPRCQFPVMLRCLCQIRGHLEQTLHGISAE